VLILHLISHLVSCQVPVCGWVKKQGSSGVFWEALDDGAASAPYIT